MHLLLGHIMSCGNVILRIVVAASNLVMGLMAFCRTCLAVVPSGYITSTRVAHAPIVPICPSFGLELFPVVGCLCIMFVVVVLIPEVDWRIWCCARFLLFFSFLLYPPLRYPGCWYWVAQAGGGWWYIHWWRYRRICRVEH